MLGGKARQARRTSGNGARRGDAQFYEPRLRRLEDRRVLAVGAIVVEVGADQSDIVEGERVSISGAAFTDSTSGGNEPHSAQIDWGDGNVEGATISEPTANDPGTIGGSHQYVDDGSYTVNVTVTGADLTSISDSLTANVVNQAPSNILLVGAPAVDENDIYTLSDAFDDPGILDTHTITIEWGDGTTPEDVPIAVDDRSFSAMHQYLDDGLKGSPSHSYAVTETVTDDDLQADSASVDLSVSNLTPQNVDVMLDSATIDENGSVTLTGSFTDPESLDAHTVFIQWGDGGTATINLLPGVSQFAEMHTYLDDQPGIVPDIYSIDVAVIDDDGDMGAAGIALQVNNVAPQSLTVSITPSVISERGTVTLDGRFIEVGTLDGKTVEINWGDGSANTAISLAPGETSFSKTHVYADDEPSATSADTYSVSVTVTDDDTGAVTAVSMVEVQNVPPDQLVLSLSDVMINEDGSVTLNGSFDDPGTEDAHEIEIDWGDGSPPTTIFLNGGEHKFSVGHQYLDDNPTGTPADNYVIGLALTDDDTGEDLESVAVTVNNVAPTLGDLATTAIDENGVTTLTGSINDPGSLDSFTLVVNWGDPLSPDNVETYTFVAGTTTFTLAHQYLDDNPTGTPADNYMIGLTLTDDDTGEDLESVSVTVNNVIPSQIVFTATATTIHEMDAISISGTFADTGLLDTHTLMVDWGDGTKPEAITVFTFANGAGTFSASHTYLDDNPTNSPSDINSIRVFVTDDDLGTGVGSLDITVNDIAPVINTISATQLDSTGSTTMHVTFSDIGVQDTFTIVIDWADGGPLEMVTLAAGSTSYQQSHQYFGPPNPARPGDDIPITVTVLDDDTLKATQVTLSDVPVDFEFGIGFADLDPNTPRLEFPMAAGVSGTSIDAPPPVSTSRTFEDRRGGFEANVRSDRRVVLTTVTVLGEDGEEVVLPQETLDDLKSLFRGKPDGRYRIYLRQGNIERLILEVDVRQGKPVDPGDDIDGTRDRPPTSQSEPAGGLQRLAGGSADNGDAVDEPLDTIDGSAPVRLLRVLRRRLASC